MKPRGTYNLQMTIDCIDKEQIWQSPQRVKFVTGDLSLLMQLYGEIHRFKHLKKGLSLI